MKKIEIENLEEHTKNGNYDILYGSFGFSVVDKIENRYKMALPFKSCRGWMGDALFKQKNPTATEVRVSYPFTFKVNIETGSTFIAIYLNTDRDENIKIETFLANLKWLHKKEEQAGVKKSKVFATQDNRIYLVEGSKYWKDSCWKIMLYTFYLKCMMWTRPKFCDTFYWDALRRDKNEEKLLGKIKIKKEIFCTSVYGTNLNMGHHDKEGFVSICNGKNPPMAKLLGLAVPTEVKKVVIAW